MQPAPTATITRRRARASSSGTSKKPPPGSHRGRLAALGRLWLRDRLAGSPARQCRTPCRPPVVSTWGALQRRGHRMKELDSMGEIYNHQYLWDNRMAPRIYDAFVDIWDREDLWVTIDKANLNLPVKGDSQGFIHWDVDTSLTPLPVGVQGVLSLTPLSAKSAFGYGANAILRSGPRFPATRAIGRSATPRQRSYRRWARSFWAWSAGRSPVDRLPGQGKIKMPVNALAPKRFSSRPCLPSISSRTGM